MRVLVCGSREWTDPGMVFEILDGLLARNITLTVIEGGAKGADWLAANWCANRRWSVEREQYPADWDTHGKAAGPIRNQRMLDEGKPDLVVAFKDGFQRDEWEVTTETRDGYERLSNPYPVKTKGGTEDMVRRAKTAGIPVYIVSHG